MKQKAFTLVELLIVIAIIGLLSGLAAVSYAGIQAKGRDAQRKNDLNQIKVVLSTYYNAQVPTQYISSASKITINNSTDLVTAALKPNYLKELPLDPVNSGDHVYKYQSFNNAADFKLFATLENKSDKKGWGSGTAWEVDGFVLQNE